MNIILFLRQAVTCTHMLLFGSIEINDNVVDSGRENWQLMVRDERETYFNFVL